MAKKVEKDLEKGGEEAEKAQKEKYQITEEEHNQQIHVLACVIDYLCLKLGWSTDQVMDNPHFDTERKFEFYQAMDNVERSRFIFAVPLGFDKKTTQSARGKYNQAVNKLNKFMKGSGAEQKQQNELLDMLGGKDGFEKFMRDMKAGKVEMKQLPISKFGSGN